MELKKKIEIYGDSIMRGVLLDRETNRYYFKKDTDIVEFQEQFPFEIKNQSKFGCTIEKGSRMLEKALSAGLSCDMLVLEYGGNDCDFNWAEVADAPDKEHLPHTPLHQFEVIYRSMVKRLKEMGITPIIMTLPPIDAEKYFAWFTRGGLNRENILKWMGDVQLIYRFQELYSLAATKIARETKCLLVDVRSAFLGRHNYKDLICSDGIHPTEAGHQIIADTFSAFAKEKLDILLREHKRKL